MGKAAIGWQVLFPLRPVVGGVLRRHGLFDLFYSFHDSF